MVCTVLARQAPSQALTALYCTALHAGAREPQDDDDG